MANKTPRTTGKTQTAARPKQARSPYVTGIIVAVVLAVLTLIEYYIGLHFPSPTVLMLMSVLKAALVIYWFMHVYRLWRADEGGH